MNTSIFKLGLAILASSACLISATPASAHDDVRWSVSVGVPVYTQQPVYVQPAPSYYPPVVQVRSPSYYAPSWREREWHEREWREHEWREHEQREHERHEWHEWHERHEGRDYR